MVPGPELTAERGWKTDRLRKIALEVKEELGRAMTCVCPKAGIKANFRVIPKTSEREWMGLSERIQRRGCSSGHTLHTPRRSGPHRISQVTFDVGSARLLCACIGGDWRARAQFNSIRRSGRLGGRGGLADVEESFETCRSHDLNGIPGAR